jgi:transcriptional regulator with XRE-family HTH domain
VSFKGVYLLKDIKDLGVTLKSLREQMGKTQMDAADFTGLRQCTISYIERGSFQSLTRINVQMLLRLYGFLQEEEIDSFLAEYNIDYSQRKTRKVKRSFKQKWRELKGVLFDYEASVMESHRLGWSKEVISGHLEAITKMKTSMDEIEIK